MKIHEYQAKELFRTSGIPVLSGLVSETPEQAQTAFEKLGEPIAVVKAQIHAGGRGKGHIDSNPQQKGVVLVRSAHEAKAAAAALLGQRLVTIQTGPKGQTVWKVYVEAGCKIERELYLAITIDRNAARPLMIASTAGGMEIETVADGSPELIHREHFDPAIGIEPFQVRKLCKKLSLPKGTWKAAHQFLTAISCFFVKYDCSLVEINPLVITAERQLVALDAKVTIDDNALFRHPELESLRDLSEEDESEIRAARAGLSYIKLDGNIGCLVNGAGLAMATMDIIKYHGGEPANFLDVGGSATTEQVTEAFRILLSDQQCQGVLVNIFGGIARCTTIAEAILRAAQELDINVPLVVRLEGTEVDEARRMLENSNVDIITAIDLNDAAKRIVAAVKS